MTSPSPAVLVAELLQQGVELRVNALGELGFRATPGAMTPEVKARVGAQKGEVIAYLRALRLPGTAELTRIEAVAIAQGWTHAELWETAGPMRARGLVCFLRLGDRIVAVSRARITYERRAPTPARLSWYGHAGVRPVWQGSLHARLEREAPPIDVREE
ncbi:MAG: hypothetical protein AMXMBFR64_04950 [Myxococcales bacterium]